MIPTRRTRIEIIAPWLVAASIVLACALLILSWRMLDLSMSGPSRTLRSIPQQWSMKLAASASWLTAQAVLIGALPLLWRRRTLHGIALKVISVLVVLSSVASLALALAD